MRCIMNYGDAIIKQTFGKFCVGAASIILVLFTFIEAQSQSHAQIEGRVYIMRHTDKADSETEPAQVAGFENYCFPENGLENPTGRVRALGLRTSLADVDFQRAFSSIFCRTAQTAFLVSDLKPVQTMVNPSDPADFAAMLIGNLQEAGGHILVVLHSPWIENLTKSRSFKGEIWSAKQCYGEVRVYRTDGKKLILEDQITNEVTWLEDGSCKK